MRSFVLAVLTIGALLVCALGAADKPTDGKALFRNNCKVCHDKGSKNGTYTPMTLTQDQWRRFFNAKFPNTHKNTMHPQEGKKLMDVLTPEQIKSIQRFAIDHAADSEQPATCG